LAAQSVVPWPAAAMIGMDRQDGGGRGLGPGLQGTGKQGM
jgi:hypothetical protein